MKNKKKAIQKTFLIITLLIAVVACGDEAIRFIKITRYSKTVETNNDLRHIRDDLLNHHLVDADTNEKIVIQVRNLIHNSITFGGYNAHDWEDYWGRYIGAINGEEQHRCGGQSYLYMLALKAMGIQSRYVGIFNSINAGYESHATVEVFIDGNWWVSDPTFNTSVLSEAGDYLGWKDIRSSKSYNLTNEDHKTWWDNCMEKGYTNYMIIFSTDAKQVEIVPSSWDGILSNGVNLMPTKGNMYLKIMELEEE